MINTSLLTGQQKRVYPEHVLAKSSTGIGTPKRIEAHKSPSHNAAFFVRDAQSCQFMVGRVRQPNGWPVTLIPGSSNLARSASITRLEPPEAVNKTESRSVTMAQQNQSRVIPFQQPSVQDQLNTCSVMNDLQDKRIVIHDLAALLNKSLQEDSSNPSLPSLARAIMHTVETMEEDLQDLAVSAELYASQSH